MVNKIEVQARDLTEGLFRTTIPAVESQIPDPVPFVLSTVDMVDITQQGSTYYVVLNLDWFTSYSDIGRAFLIWLYTRAPDDVIQLSLIHQCSADTLKFWLTDNTSLLQALSECSATVVGHVDSPTLGLDAYVLMACDKLTFGPYGVISVRPAWSGAAGKLSIDAHKRLSFVHKLYAHAVILQLLTEDEVASLIEGRTVTLLPQHWADAAFEHLHFTQEHLV